MYYVRSIPILRLGDLNYVTSIYRQTLRSYERQYKEVSSCTNSATETPEQISKYVLSPKTDRTTYQS